MTICMQRLLAYADSNQWRFVTANGSNILIIYLMISLLVGNFVLGLVSRQSVDMVGYGVHLFPVYNR